MTEQKVLQILQHHVPAGALHYCHSLWIKNPFQLKITRSRHSKAGDFFCSNAQPIPRITINNDLNPYLFLVTYIHEVAHLHIHNKHNHTTSPHGKEWKQCFQQLMMPVLNSTVFPESFLPVLINHMQNPMASSFADAELTKAFRLFDPKGEDMVTVSELPEGTHFLLRGKHFKKGKLRRTRFLCDELKSKRKYLVPAEALVSSVQFQLF